MRLSRLIFRTALAAACLFAAGCAEEEIPYTEVKKIDEPLSEREITSFLSIVDSLPDKKLPALPTIVPPLPQWSTSSTRLVSKMVQEEQKSLKEYSSETRLIKPLGQSRAFKQGLRRERMTPEQFAGLVLAIGIALMREEVPAERDLEQLIARGNRSLGQLEKDMRVYSSLKEDVAYQVLEQATWIPLLEQLQRLNQVPAENRALIKRRRTELNAIFPEEFRRNPLAGYDKVLEDQGTPFEELRESGSDDRIVWQRDQAIIGKPPETAAQ